MSWRGRDERTTRWGENRERSPVWEKRSESPDRRPPSPRDRQRDRRDRHERYDRDRRDRDRDSERYNRRFDKRDRERDRRRSPRRLEDRDVPAAPSPPKISADYDTGEIQSRSRSGSRDRGYKDFDHKYDRDKDDQSVNASPGDWVCKCGSYNFKRRQVCYRRNCSGKRSEGVVYGDGQTASECNAGITKRLLFRRLDALTTEEKILEVVKERCSKSVLDSIAGIKVGRETLTGASKCLAYINFNSLADSTAAHSELLSLDPPLVIDNREVLISFYNEPQKTQKPHAEYPNYYNQMSSYSRDNMSEADRVNAAAAVAQSAITAAQARQMSWTPVSVPVFVSSTSQATPAVNVPIGDGKTVYSAPDVRTFMYDETSGYYYDPATGLYYDGNTQYFYNSTINQYMYWDAATSTYIAASQTQTNSDQPKLQNPPDPTAGNTITKEPEEKKKKDKEDKVKVAKKIAKDMERWAKTLNQKKENAKSNFVMEQPLDTSASKGSADIGFSVLGAGPSLTHVRELSPPPVISTDDFLLKKNEPNIFDIDEGIIDWSKLTCLLCKRKFPSVDVLTKHKNLSDLHKQNLAEHRKKNELLPQTNGYRDRAAERRMKFGEDDPPPIRKRYEAPEIHSQVMSHPPPSVIDTIGGKMLKNMGWSEGRGLGKEEQGRINPIEAEQRPSLAGLGQKRGIYTPTPGLTYRDTVKKLMIARYKEVVGQEDGS
ncbi:RNA-binding protein 5 isoform 1 [Danaus plexippus plexippus]|uniref:RNA-binding protein 5 isoform 1 n=1 Tax=Danaus plexippus plexippus TaxID=278856 RepID=A0A212EM11_DANPL|nr:RNA-binding protein 5-A-like [Danaus plexippus plexippus]XP_032521768.1 RNA-binding protein 5-A-like [Danaus plexippus plexippus]XP_032521769.1 RNA-binding protein 5-A-like [Danaus plexippus plexippus]OWR42540.1 RNA-binding protein 5 isoform 1 [Danaus plexippus plexippus]